MPGLFITFEGVDGCGKTTQLHHVAQYLRNQGYEVVETREPGGTIIAEKVRQMVLDAALPLNNTTQALLFAAARSEHVEKVLRPAVAAGKIVLCDRYLDSTLVYQGYAAAMGEAYLKQLYALNQFATENFLPDKTIFLEAEPRELLARRAERGVTDRFEEKGLAFQNKLYAGFKALAKQYPERITSVAALGTEDEVQKAVLQVIEDLLKRL